MGGAQLHGLDTNPPKWWKSSPEAWFEFREKGTWPSQEALPPILRRRAVDQVPGSRIAATLGAAGRATVGLEEESDHHSRNEAFARHPRLVEFTRALRATYRLFIRRVLAHFGL